jgi:hypothetical protein
MASRGHLDEKYQLRWNFDEMLTEKKLQHKIYKRVNYIQHFTISCVKKEKGLYKRSNIFQWREGELYSITKIKKA